MFDVISHSINPFSIQKQNEDQNEEPRSRPPREEREREDRGDVEARNFTYRIGFFQQIIHSQPASIHIEDLEIIDHRDTYPGGPGSGKGTQCAKIVETFGFKHLSAGDLLRREIACNSKYGSTILNTIKEGRIVPSEVTVKLIQREMESSDNHKFLIDGFPRSEENRIAFERIMGAEPNIVLFFDCPEEEMVKRVLSRNQGRVDDNLDTMKKRLKVFEAWNLPVINYYAEKGKLHKISALGTEDEIFEQVRPLFAACEINSKTLLFLEGQ
ncbi:UMP-CMP kinase isoform X2 [Corylus avellana]|uniref:UMP-CMP kinase isoform X2 n=1 Tax=Corylus avellana TaxID=13451 RepID=UPI00286B9BE8|nr:UMP-CMP kinase isoform X2 [Corylus avellana]